MPKISQAEYAKAAMDFLGNKERIIQEFKDGMTLSQFAAREGISVSTLKSMLDTIGIDYRRQKRQTLEDRVADLEARMATIDELIAQAPLARAVVQRPLIDAATGTPL